MIIDLVRHTTPDIEAGICYGQSDLGLKNSFDEECAQIHQKLSTQYDLVVSSPLQRCAILAQTFEASKHYSDARLMEYDFGDWELTPWSELTSAQARAWMDDFVQQSAPNGESLVDMQKRVLQFWNELLQKDLQRVAIVTHSGVQRLLHAHILKTPLSHLFRLELNFGAIIRITHNAESGLATIKHL